VLSAPLPDAPRPLVFSVLRVPFFLEPDYDETKPFIETNRQRLISKWGGPQGWETQKHRHGLKQRGIEAGIPHFNLDRLTSNTMASHRLIQYIGKRYGLDISEAVYDQLNQYYFVDGFSLNDRPKIAKLVSDLLKKHKLHQHQNPPSPDHLLQFLNSNQGRSEIEHALQRLHHLGVHGIPKFIIEGKTVVDGAARADTFIKIFRQIEARGHVFSDQPVFADILGIDPHIVRRGSHRAAMMKEQREEGV